MKVHLKFRDAKQVTHHFPGDRLLIVLELDDLDKAQVADMAARGERMVAFAAPSWNDDEVLEVLDKLNEHRAVLPRGAGR